MTLPPGIAEEARQRGLYIASEPMRGTQSAWEAPMWEDVPQGYGNRDEVSEVIDIDKVLQRAKPRPVSFEPVNRSPAHVIAVWALAAFFAGVVVSQAPVCAFSEGCEVME